MMYQARILVPRYYVHRMQQILKTLEKPYKPQDAEQQIDREIGGILRRGIEKQYSENPPKKNFVSYALDRTRAFQLYRKTCTKCKQPKKATEFSKDNSRPDGLQPVCKECNKEYIQNRKQD